MILPPSLAELDKRQTFEQEAGFKTQLHHEQGSLKKWTGRIGTGGVWGTGEERAEDGSSTVKQER